MMNRDRSPLHGRGDGDIDDITRGDRSRRGDKPSRFGPRSNSPNLGGRKGGAEKRIFISNIAYEYRWQELKDLFRQEVGEVSYVELFVDDNNKPRGCGIVEFESADSVQKAVDKMHRFDLNGRKLVVKEDFGVERDKCGRPMKGERESLMGGGGSGGGGGRDNMQDMRDMPRHRDEPRMKWEPNSSSLNAPQLSNSGQSQSGSGNNQWGNTYGLSPQFLEGLWINGPLVPKVFVANLDYKVDRKKLKEVFKMAGKVVRAELHLDKDGKSRGFGVIEYDHPVEAVQAISMFHNQMLFERKLTVRMDRVENKMDAPVKLPEGLRGIGMGLGTNGSPLQDVSRNLPSLTQTTGLIGPVPTATGNMTAANFSALSNAAALSNVVNSSSMGLGNSGPIGMGGLGNGMLSSGLGGPGDLSGLGASLSGGGGFGGGNMGAGLNVSGQMANAAALANAGNAFGTSNAFLGSAFGGSAATSLAGGAFGGGGRDFDSMNGVLGSGYITGTGDRDFRTMQAPAGSGFQNNQSRQIGSSSSSLLANSAGASNNGNNIGNRGRDMILVKNLPNSFTWQMLRDKFRDVGEVKYAEMRAKDAGLVRFNNEWDAERAVHMMDRKRVDGRAIDVSLFG